MPPPRGGFQIQAGHLQGSVELSRKCSRLGSVALIDSPLGLSGGGLASCGL